MKQIRTYILIVLVNITVCQVGFSQNDYSLFPTYKEVVRKFFEKYSTEEMNDSTQFKFEKKPDGWHVTLRGYTGAKKKQTTLPKSRSKNFI